MEVLWHYGPNKMEIADKGGRLEYCIWEEHKKRVQANNLSPNMPTIMVITGT